MIFKKMRTAWGAAGLVGGIFVAGWAGQGWLAKKIVSPEAYAAGRHAHEVQHNVLEEDLDAQFETQVQLVRAIGLLHEALRDIQRDLRYLADDRPLPVLKPTTSPMDEITDAIERKARERRQGLRPDTAPESAPAPAPGATP